MTGRTSAPLLAGVGYKHLVLAVVLSDEMTISPDGATLRRVRYRDPVTGEVYSFITK